MAKLRQLFLLVETDDGKIYEANLSPKQENAVRAILAALPEPLQLLKDPLEGIEINRSEDGKEGE